MSTRSASQEPVKDLDAPEASTSRSTSSGRQEDDNSQDHGHQDNNHQREPLKEGHNEDEDSEENGAHEDDREDQEKATDENDGSASVDAPNQTPGAQGDWQAIWAPTQNAYYFYNVRTHETTWTNPLQPQSTNGGGAADADSSAYPVASTSNAADAAQAAAAAAAEAAGIDPSLAYLDPSLGLPTNAPAGTFTAKFNARTGAFTRMDARDPSHLSEAERAKRMSQVYFDVAAWEQEVEERTIQEAVEAAEGSGKKRKRPTKKDLEKFKEQKRLKKIAKTAWLRT